jgi:tripartite-type tricarboxylate transporter receptor subunit TctC
MNKKYDAVTPAALSRRAFVVSALAATAATASPALAADYPSQNVRVVIPYPAGGPTDIAGRLMTNVLEKATGRAFVVENKAGASGTIGAEDVSRATPDGHTLLVNASAHVIYPAIMKSLRFDVISDFRPVTQLVSVPIILLLHPSLPATNVKELIAYIKANPGKLSFASSSRGGATHLAGELFKQLNQLDMLHVPYRGAAPALTDLMAGHVQIMFDSMLSASGHVQSGALKALAVSTPQRSALLPNLPTMVEAGIPGFAFTNWYGLWAPKSTPKAVLDRLIAELNKGYKSAEITEKLRAIGAEPVISPPDEFAKFCESEKDFWAKVVTAAGLEKE